MASLNTGREVKLHVIAQVVEPKLVVSSVGNICSVSGLTFEVVHVVLNTTDLETKEPMDLAHPLCVAGGQIIVHGHNVDAAATGQCIQVRGQGGNERFPFTCSHLSNLALMENHAADQLHIEVAHTGCANTCFTHRSKCFRQEFVENCPLASLSLFFILCITDCLLHCFLKLSSASFQLVVGKFLQGWFERVDLLDCWLNSLQKTLIVATKNFR